MRQASGSKARRRSIVAALGIVTLAVLSACSTASGDNWDGQGLQGLARAFLESGTRNLLVTRWPVEDGAAAKARGAAVADTQKARVLQACHDLRSTGTSLHAQLTDGSVLRYEALEGF